MTDAIAHRGPDGEGFFVEGSIGLGHRRLAILDLSPAGHQPMQTRDGNFVISYNGEIYNFRELRLELERLGHQFHSDNDAEVVVNAWAACGPDSLHRLTGMLAFALWDKAKRTLTLARDRYGIKPMYYTRQKNLLLFGSEIKAIAQHPGYQTSLDKQALLEYFTFQNFLTDKTLFADVSVLPPGSTLTVQVESSAEAAPKKYWDYRFAEPQAQLKEAEYLEELDRLLQQAVTRQLVSDVEIGSFLSGGMDSGAISSIAAGHLPYIKTFTCGFDLTSASGLELLFDERQMAEYMSALFKTEHYEMVLKAGDMERAMSRLAYHIEEPRVGQSYPNYYASHLASKFVKVALSGTGGDELFGGYPWRYYRAVGNKDFQSYVDSYYSFWQRLIDNRDLRRMFAPIWGDVKGVWTRDIFESVFENDTKELDTPEQYVNHSLYFEAKTFLHGLLIVDDKLAMSHGLEQRVPFLDNDLVDFAMGLPVGLKLGKLQEAAALDRNTLHKRTPEFFNKSKDGKLLLRKAMQRHLPQKITGAVKQGFSAPDASWFRGESIDYVRTKLLSRRARIYEFFDRDTVGDLVGQHLSGKVNRRLYIWSLLSFEHWCETFLP